MLSRLSKLTVGRRIIAAFGVLTVMLLALATVSFVTVDNIADETDYALKVNAATSEHAARARVALGDLRRFEKDLFLSIGDSAKEAEYESSWNAERELFVAALVELEKHVDTDAEKKQLVEVREAFKTYEGSFHATVARIRTKEISKAADANAAIEA